MKSSGSASGLLFQGAGLAPLSLYLASVIHAGQLIVVAITGLAVCRCFGGVRRSKGIPGVSLADFVDARLRCGISCLGHIWASGLLNDAWPHGRLLSVGAARGGILMHVWAGNAAVFGS